MASRTLNLPSAVRYLQVVGVDKLDGLYEAVCQKLSQLDSGPVKRGAHKEFPIGGSDAPGGSVKGILAFVDTCDKGDVTELQTIESVIRTRHGNAGYKPKASDPLPAHEPLIQPKGGQGKKEAAAPKARRRRR